MGVCVVLLVGLLCVPVAAAASCAAPELTYDGGEVHPGDTVTVVGQHWGDDCYDTGNQPAGEGVLGLPRTGIVVVFEQGGTQTIVARGDADTEYQFQVAVVIPQTAAPGEARLVARVGDTQGYDDSREPLSVASAGDGSPVRVASFGPTEEPAPTPESTPNPPDSPAMPSAGHESGEPTASTGEPVGHWWPAYTAAAVLAIGGLLPGRRWQRSTRSA